MFPKNLIKYALIFAVLIMLISAASVAAQEPSGEPEGEGTVAVQDTVEPTEEATVEPTEEATVEPTVEPTVVPTVEATVAVAADEISDQGLFNPGTGTSKIGIMNIDPSTSGTATYSVLFYNQSSGGPDDTSTVTGRTLAYKGAAYYDLGSLGLVFGDGWNGSVVIQADKNFFAAVDNRYSGGTYTGGDNFNGEAYEAPELATDIFLPYATNNGVNRWSRITIQGTKATDAETTNVTISYTDEFGDDATCSNPTSRAIQGSRAWTFEPVYNCGVAPNGSIRIQSPDPIIAAFDGSWGDSQTAWKTAYMGVPASKASNKLYYPSIFRRVSSANWIQWSNILVQNVTDTEVTVRISYYAEGATSPSLEYNQTIPPLTQKGNNTRFGNEGNYNQLGGSFAGTVVVEKVSGPDNALIGVAHNFWGTTFFGGSTYTAFGESEGGSTIYAPFALRKQAGSTWTEWSNVSVMNLSGSSVALDVKFYNSSGSQVLDLTGAIGSVNVPDASVWGVNTRFGCSAGTCNSSALNGLGTSFEGTVVISGPPGSKLVSTMNTLYPNRLNTFNAKASD